jgi:hypothetical protein
VYAVLELQTGEEMLDTSALVYSGFKDLREAKEFLENKINEYKEEYNLFEEDEEYNTIYRIEENQVRIEVSDNFYVMLKIVEISCKEKQFNVISF